MKVITKTTVQLKALQTKAQALVQTLNKEVIVVTGGKQHVNAKPGNIYELSVKDSDVLNKGFDNITTKIGNDLKVLLPNNAIAVFDGYFEVCASDLSCLVLLPTEGGIYYVVSGNFVTLAQIVHFYGDKNALASITFGQSALFAQSFNEVYFADGFSLSSVGASELSFTAIMGEFIVTHGTTVEVFASDDTVNPLGSATYRDGKFVFNKGNYSGSTIIVKLTDNNDNADYYDEASGVHVDLNTTLLAIFNLSSGKTEFDITVLTTIAAIKAGLSASGAFTDAFDEGTASQTSKAVLEAFGVTENDREIAVVDKDGNTKADATFYGQIAAALSGTDSETGNSAVTINQYVNYLEKQTDGSYELNIDGQNVLYTGVAKTEANNNKIVGLVDDIKATVGSGATIEIVLSFKDSGADLGDGLTKYETINIVGVTAGDWVYSIDGGVTAWSVRTETSFILADGTYNKANIRVKAGTDTSVDTTGGTKLADNGQLTVDAVINAVAFDFNSSSSEMNLLNLESDTTWKYTVDGGNTWIAASDGSDSFKLSPDSSFTAGDNTSIQVEYTDKAGNTAKTTKAFTLDTTAPSAPTVALTNDSGTTANTTNDGSLSVSGLPADNAKVAYFVTKGTDTESATMTAAEYQTYIDAREAANDDVGYSVRVVATDNAGNTAETTKAFTLDTQIGVVDLDSEDGIDDTSSVDANKVDIAAGIAFDSAIATPSVADIDIEEIKIVLGGSELDTTNDMLVLNASDVNKWFWKASATGSFFDNPVDISTWAKSTQTAPDSLPSIVGIANIENAVANSTVTYTVMLSHVLEQNSFTATDIKIIDAADVDVTANWTIGTPATTDGISRTVEVTPLRIFAVYSK